MKINKKNVNPFIRKWIKTDEELNYVLRDYQIEILKRRILDGEPFEHIAFDFKVSGAEILEEFHHIVRVIEKTIGSKIARALWEISSQYHEPQKKTWEDYEQAAKTLLNLFQSPLKTSEHGSLGNH